jgi:ATP-dependent Clp protease ATP-binding subunit ClpX
LKFEDNVLDYIVEKAIEFRLGARGLRSIVEAIMIDFMFEFPDQNVEEVTVALDYAKAKLEKLNFKRLRAA